MEHERRLTDVFEAFNLLALGPASGVLLPWFLEFDR